MDRNEGLVSLSVLFLQGLLRAQVSIEAHFDFFRWLVGVAFPIVVH